MMKLGDICDLQNGYAFKSSDYVDSSQTLSCRMSNIRPGGVFDIDYNSRFLPDDFATKYSQFLLNDGDVIIAMTDLADSPKILGVPTVVETLGRNILLNQRVGKLVIKDTSLIHFPYLKLALNYPKVREVYKRYAGGGLQINLGKADLLSVEIPLPPLAEQKRIAAILDKADAIRRKRQQAIQLADDFLRAVFLEMFGDPVTNPKGWEVKPLKDVLKSISSGWSANGDSRPCEEGELGVLKISAVTSGAFIPTENKAVQVSDIPSSKKLVFPKKGDMLFSRANTRELVAASCIVVEDSPNTFLPDKLWLIKTDESQLLPEYLNYLLKIPGFKEKLTSQATGSSGSMLNISMSKFGLTECLVPPINLQHRFKNMYWKLQETLSGFEESESTLKKSFNALSQKAFSGQL